MRNIINVKQGTKGVMAFAEIYDSKWLVIIDTVDSDDYQPWRLMVYSNFSYDINTECMSTTHHSRWSYLDEPTLTFYEATEQEKQEIKQILKQHKLKYVKGINKIFPR